MYFKVFENILSIILAMCTLKCSKAYFSLLGQYLWTISALSLDQLIRWLIGVGPLAGRMAGQQIAYVYSVNHGAMGQLNKKTKTITVSGRAGLIQACCVHSCVRWMYSGTYDFKDF